MRQLSFKRHRFTADVIRHSIWLYARLTLSFRDVEEIPMHCSGINFIEAMRGRMPDQLVGSYFGSRFTFGL